jgi:hypothetical protein
VCRRWLLAKPVHGTLFADYGSDLDSGETVIGDPAGTRGKPGRQVAGRHIQYLAKQMTCGTRIHHVLMHAQCMLGCSSGSAHWQPQCAGVLEVLQTPGLAVSWQSTDVKETAPSIQSK